MEMIFAQECECTNCQRNVHLKMVKMINLTLCMFYSNKKNVKKSDFGYLLYTFVFYVVSVSIFFFLMLFLSAYILFMYVCMYVCMALLGLRFCARAFSSCGKWGPLFIAVRGPLTIAVSRCRAQAPDAQAQ